MSRVLIVGCGAAGMAAAIASAGCGHEVHIYEKNEKPGKKLFITGKGRCNVTNACSMESLRQNVVTNPRFLYSSFAAFSNRDMMDLLTRAGCPLKTERGGRVFPASDKSSDVIAALVRQMRELGVHLHLETEVTGLRTEPGMSGLHRETEVTELRAEPEMSGLHRETEVTELRAKPEMSGLHRVTEVTGLRAEAEVCADARNKRAATGALKDGADQGTGTGQRIGSLPSGRNDGSISREIHTATHTAGADRSTAAAAQPLRCTGITVRTAGKREAAVAGNAVIVATGGISYPATGSTGDGYRFAKSLGHTVTELTPSLVPFCAAEEDVKSLQGLSLKNVGVSVSDGGRELYRGFGEMLFTHFGVSGPLILNASSYVGRILKEKPLMLRIDLKPALAEEQLDARILRDFAEFSNRQFSNALGKLYPVRLIPVIVARSGIAASKPVRDITRGERKRLLDVTKRFAVTLTALRGFDEAIITQGGISVKEISPATMESKKVRGLYFAGEVLDLDAVTGGFNLQIAWSTGWAAGSGIPRE